jgi:pimeloyl-ACP methyl ester carboxylesterase
MLPLSRRTFLAAAAAAVTLPAQVQSRPLKRMKVNGGEIEYEVVGTGEPVLMIHGTGVAATFYNVLTEPAMAGYRMIRMHRRGFAGSSRTPVPFTLKDHAADAKALLTGLGVGRAHIVGHSVGGMVTLQLALDEPGMVHSLVIMEPPIFNPAAPPASFVNLTNTYKSGDKAGAMNTFSQMSYGEDWRTLALRVPGGPDQVMADVDTVYTTEVPAMTGWTFGQAQADRIKQPITYITGGGGHGASRTQFKQWMPRIEEVIIPGVTHAMLMQNPKAVSEAIAAFLNRNAL